jgi:hypothetical protein
MHAGRPNKVPSGRDGREFVIDYEALGLLGSRVGPGASAMRCYFLRDGRIAGVEVLPADLSDEAAIARARALARKRKGPLDSLEVWDHARFVYRRPLGEVESPDAHDDTLMDIKPSQPG